MVAIETRRRLREAALLAMLAPVAACDLHPPRTADLPGNAQLLLVNPALSMVTQRQRPVSGIVASRDVLCVQPNPDWASTLSRMVQFSGSGSGSGANGSLNGTVNNSESAIQLAGRTAGVVALRDGLYSACQAYANGVIGQDAYALILSQYGDLLVALAAPSPAAAPASPAAPAAAAAKADMAAPAGLAGSPLTTGIEQQEAVKALLVACLSENDPTGLHAAASNPLLRVGEAPSQACQTVIGSVALRVRDLLAPAAVAAVPPAKPKATVKRRRKAVVH